MYKEGCTCRRTFCVFAYMCLYVQLFMWNLDLCEFCEKNVSLRNTHHFLRENGTDLAPHVKLRGCVLCAICCARLYIDIAHIRESLLHLYVWYCVPIWYISMCCTKLYAVLWVVQCFCLCIVIVMQVNAYVHFQHLYEGRLTADAFCASARNVWFCVFWLAWCASTAENRHNYPTSAVWSNLYIMPMSYHFSVPLSLSFFLCLSLSFFFLNFFCTYSLSFSICFFGFFARSPCFLNFSLAVSLSPLLSKFLSLLSFEISPSLSLFCLSQNLYLVLSVSNPVHFSFLSIYVFMNYFWFSFLAKFTSVTNSFSWARTLWGFQFVCVVLTKITWAVRWT
jgi:hypothetical protein